MMNMAMVEIEVDDPPDPDVVEVDPSGRYLRYNEFLGEGAFKKVYKAFDLVEGIEVAWNQIHMDKVLQSAQDCQRLSTELHLLKTLKHKNIIKFYKSWVDEEKKTANIITELFTSGNLRDYRKKHKNVDIKAVKSWARQILTGLDYLHSHDPPIIHRDLKCSNILINGNHGEVKIADLGFATVMDRPDLQKGIGTPKFMAPELFDEDYNELVDIYSFGMCMLEMATSEYPYGECTLSAQVYKKVASGLMSVSLSNVKDPNLKQFIEKCLVPASRRLSAKELLRDSFLQVDCIAAAKSSSLPPAISSKLGNSYLPSEEPSTMQHDFQIELLAVEDGEHVVVISTEYYVSMSHMRAVKICIAKGGSNYMLKAKLCDEEHASLKLPIGKQRGKLKNIKFGFDLGNDTSLSLANEMVGEFNVSGGSVLFIAELIDLSLIKLVPNWTPTVSIDHIVDSTGVNMYEERDEEEEDGESVVSFNNLFEDVTLTDTIPSTQELLPQLCEAPDYLRMNQVDMVIVDIDSHCSAMKEDRSSTTSMMCTDENYNKCSINPCMPSEYVNDQELKAELENIELEFQRDMQEITMKRHKAIMAAQARWSQRNIE